MNQTAYFTGFIVYHPKLSGSLKISIADLRSQEIFFAAEALTVLGWERSSNRTGRNPPLVFGTLGCAAVILCFGLSKNFWMLVLSRRFNGNIGITKAVVSEIKDAINIAHAFSLTPLMWGVGVTFGFVHRPCLGLPA